MNGDARAFVAAVAAVGAVLTLGAAAFVDLRAAASVGTGAVVATGNLWALARIVVAILPRSRAGASRQSRGAWAIVAVLKLGALLAVVGLLLGLRAVAVRPLPLLVGLLSLPIGIAIGTLLSDRDGPSEDLP